MEREYIIYKIQCLTKNLVYIGSTTDYMCRKNQHKSRSSNKHANRYNDLYLYQIIRANGGFNNWIMYQIEKVNTTHMKALIREQYYIEQYKDCINRNRAYVQERENKISIEDKKKIAEKKIEEKKKIDEKNKKDAQQIYLQYKQSHPRRRRVTPPSGVVSQ